MAWPHVFGTLPAGNQPASYFDDNFNALSALTGSTLSGFTHSNSAKTPSTVEGFLRDTRVINVCDSPWHIIGGSDEITQLIALRDYCRADPTAFWEWNFPPAAYQYSELDWMRGIMNLRVNAWGATFKNVKASGGNQALLANTICFNDLPYNQFISAGVPQQFGYKIATTAADVRVIPMATAGEEANFTAGMRVLIYGYAMQSNAYPPAPLYWETAVVVSAAGGNVTIDRPTEHAYNEDWWDFTFGAAGKGAPRILSLDTPNQTQGRYFEWNGGKILVPTSPIVTALGVSPKIKIGGYEQIVLNDMETEDLVGFNPSCGWNYKINNCSFRNACENDKVIDYIDYHNCDIGQSTTTVAMFAGLGIGTLRLSGRTRIRGQWQSLALHTLIDDECEFNTRSVNNKACSIHIGDATHHKRKTEVRSAHIIANSADLTGIVGSFSESTLTVGAVVDDTHITCSAATDALAQAYYESIESGILAKTVDGAKQVIFKDVTREDATNVNILVESNAVLAPGDVLTWPQLDKLHIGNVSGSGPYWPLPVISTSVAGTTGTGLKGVARLSILGKTNPWEFTDKSLIRQASGAAGPRQTVVHYPRAPLKRIWCNVTTAYTGGSATAFLDLELATPSVVTFAIIDLKTVGWRELSLVSQFGSVGTDTLTANALAATGAVGAACTPYYADSIKIRGPYTGVAHLVYAHIYELPKFTFGFEFEYQW